MYAEDSFFSLTQFGRIGLLAVSGILFVVMIYLTRLFVTGWAWPVRLMLALILLWLFMWLSPQLYYFYYGFLFEDLPRQWVIGAPPPLGKTIRVITFTGPADLSHHGQGALGLLMVIAALGRKRDTTGF